MQFRSRLLHLLRRLRTINGPESIAFAWGFAEATFFFLVPDVWLSRLVLADRRRCLRAIFWAVLGALLGGLLMFGWGATRPEQAMRFLDRVPAISPQMIERAGRQLQNEGCVALFRGAAAGTPYKIYAVQAGRLRCPLFRFLAASAAARLVRFLLVCGLTDLVAHLFFRRRTLRIRQAVHLAAWILFYLWYFSIMSN